jgi:hypothetical protein
MAKQEILQNTFDESLGGALDKYDRKYFRYFENFRKNKMAESVINAFKSNDLPTIEITLKNIADSANNYILLIGLGCFIIDQEKLYRKADCNSYLEYAQKRLFPELKIPDATLSDAKIIVETFYKYNRPLKKAGFKIEGNAHKLRFLETALANHEEEEVYNRLANDSLRGFSDWARRANVARIAEPEPKIDIKIKENKLFLNGENILIFPKDLPEKTKDWISDDLTKTFTIREGGGDPYITETYGRGEQIAIENFKKNFRAKK